MQEPQGQEQQQQQQQPAATGAPSTSDTPLAATEYLHGSHRRTGSLQAPQVRSQDHEIEVRTAWAPLLDTDAPVARVRPEKAGDAAKYADGRLISVDCVFTPDECERLVAAADAIGFGRTSYPKSYRGNMRLITVDESLAGAVWQRLRPLLPPTLKLEGDEWAACGLNECWRLAKYVPGDRFGAHCDAWFQRTDDEMSMYTVNVYMNAVPEPHGGATRFYRERCSEAPVLSVQPETGLGVVFRQPPGESLLHDGEQVFLGTKYLFRSDVMYRRVSAGRAEAGAKVPRAG